MSIQRSRFFESLFQLFIENQPSIIKMIHLFDECIKKLENMNQDIQALIQDIRQDILHEEWQLISLKAEQLFNQTQYYKILIFQYEAYELGNVDQTLILECLLKAQQLKPSSKKVNKLLGMHYIKIKNFQKALDLLLLVKSQKVTSDICFTIGGKIYEFLNQNDKAILFYLEAHDLQPSVESYIALMETYDRLEQYEMALNCCQMLINIQNQEPTHYLRYIYFLKKLGRQNEISQVQEQLEDTQNFYNQKFYILKRDLNNDMILYEKKQSQIRLGQNKSQILSQKEQDSIKQVSDAFYYTFTLYLIQTLQLMDINKAYEEIQNNIHNQQISLFEEFNEMIPDFFNTLRVPINQKEIKDNLSEWYKKKIQKNLNQQNLIQYFYIIIGNIFKQNKIRDIIMERINENYKSLQKRIGKNRDFHNQLLATQIFADKKDSKIFNSNSGQLGLEYSVLLIAYLVQFPKLADLQEDFETFILGLIEQKDLEQFQLSQSSIKIQQQNEKNKADYNEEFLKCNIGDYKLQQQLKQLQNT